MKAFWWEKTRDVLLVLGTRKWRYFQPQPNQGISRNNHVSTSGFTSWPGSAIRACGCQRGDGLGLGPSRRSPAWKWHCGLYQVDILGCTRNNTLGADSLTIPPGPKKNPHEFSLEHWKSGSSAKPPAEVGNELGTIQPHPLLHGLQSSGRLWGSRKLHPSGFGPGAKHANGLLGSWWGWQGFACSLGA